MSSIAHKPSPDESITIPQDHGNIPLQDFNTKIDDAKVEEPPNVSNTTAAITPLRLTATVKLKLVGAAFCFFNAGVNDGSLGALIPYILRNYGINTGWMAVPFGVGFFGWLLAAIFGGYVRMILGTGGFIICGAALQLLAQVLRFWQPPFGLFSVTFLFVALGQAFQDSQANTFVAMLNGAHRWLGVIHGCYAIGCLIGPLIAAAIASNVQGQWAIFYCVPMGIGVFNVLLCGYAFRDETALYNRLRFGRSRNLRSGNYTRTKPNTAFVELAATVKQQSVWILGIFYFLYVGAAITAGGWVVEFLHVVRDGSLSRVGYISSAYYGGTALGRFLLAEPTFRFGEKRMLILYSVLCLGLQIVFWRVPNIVVDAVTVSFIGFLLGPGFATGVSVGTKLIPSELQASGLALIFVISQAGGAIFPAITGVIAAQAGVSTIQPILVGLLTAMAVAWMFVPDPRKRGLR